MSTPLLAAAGEFVITPPPGATLLGCLCPATGVHDDLFARVLVLSDGASAAAVVTLDLPGMDFALADEMREGVRAATGVEVVLLASTHTHSAPFTIPWSLKGREWLQEPAGQGWLRGMVDGVAGVAEEAATHLQPARLRAGRAPVQVGANRRAVTATGTTMHPNPDGVAIPWVDVLCVDDSAGAPLAVLFSHAAHPVIVHAASSLISADYPGQAIAALRRLLGPGVVAMCAQACGGNINGEPLRGGFEAAQRAGETLAQAVNTAIAQAQPVAAGPIRAATVVAQLPLRPLPSIEDCRDLLRRSEARLADLQGADPETAWYAADDVLCSHDLLRQASIGGPGVIRFEASALAVGDAWGLVALTHEVFAEYQLWLDRESPWPHTMVTAYTNGCETYVPTDLALDEGGYEAVTYPDAGAAMRYPYRVAMAPGGEALVRAAMRDAVLALSPSG